MRVTSAPARHRRRKRLMKAVKGAFGDRKNHIRLSKTHLLKALSYPFVHRKLYKRSMRRLWTVRINAAARMSGISYSKLVDGMKKANIEIDRKMLADLAVRNDPAFKEVVEKAKAALA